MAQTRIHSFWTKLAVARWTHEKMASTVTCLQVYRLGASLTGMHAVDDACAQLGRTSCKYTKVPAYLQKSCSRACRTCTSQWL